MAEYKEQFEERTVTLKVTKRRLTQEEKEEHEKKHGSPIAQTEEPPSNCGPWYFKIEGGHTYSCRICYEGYPTVWPIERCVGPLPD